MLFPKKEIKPRSGSYGLFHGHLSTKIVPRLVAEVVIFDIRTLLPLSCERRVWHSPLDIGSCCGSLNPPRQAGLAVYADSSGGTAVSTPPSKHLTGSGDRHLLGRLVQGLE